MSGADPGDGPGPTDFGGIVQRLSSARSKEARVVSGRAPRDRDCVAVEPIPMAPLLPPALREAVRDWSNPHPDVGFDRSRATPMVVEAARLALPQLEARHRAAGAEDWRAFLFLLAGDAINAPTGPDLDLAIGRIMAALPAMPVCVLTAERQGQGLRRFRFFPRAYEMAEWLAPHVGRERAALLALRRLATTAPLPPPGAQRDPGTPAERLVRAERTARLEVGLRAEEDAARRGRAAALARLPDVSLKPEALRRARAGEVPRAARP